MFKEPTCKLSVWYYLFTQIYKLHICHAWTCEFSDLRLTEKRCINMSIYSHFGAL